ncbi:hypothetical protein EV356DRAFT_510388 [Viridothelium virens]|uniref:Uncharacterized protein n=1 Tax=Viridothelium virens TaxID=1048519 RepID=A0A6A6GVL5_VIRVR|nr:hypothetical protein EV356DRAFT_510388 [Viridothelium virens]
MLQELEVWTEMGEIGSQLEDETTRRRRSLFRKTSKDLRSEFHEEMTLESLESKMRDAKPGSKTVENYSRELKRARGKVLLEFGRFLRDNENDMENWRSVTEKAINECLAKEIKALMQAEMIPNEQKTAPNEQKTAPNEQKTAPNIPKSKTKVSKDVEKQSGTVTKKSLPTPGQRVMERQKPKGAGSSSEHARK